MAYVVAKRFIDIVLSVLGLIILSPIMLIAAIGILIEDGRPIIFSQVRVGKGKKDFLILKFRSMKNNASELHEELRKQNGDTNVSFKLKDQDDPRVLKVGHFIRKYNIDELPQLINILKGDMTLVGPRPLPKYEAVDTDKVYGDRYDERYMVSQGLTCYWQVSDRAKVSYEERMALDCKYAKEANLLIDLRLIFKTAAYAVGGRAEY